jgi:acyl-CoA synthetase (AMP-forming)/AMP-acid ligase II
MTAGPQLTGTPATLLARHAADPARVFAVVEDDRGGTTVISYAQELSRARAVAGALAALGVEAGDRVHLHTANCPEFFDAWFATALLGTRRSSWSRCRPPAPPRTRMS